VNIVNTSLPIPAGDYNGFLASRPGFLALPATSAQWRVDLNAALAEIHKAQAYARQHKLAK